MHPNLPCNAEERDHDPSTDFDPKGKAPHPSSLDPTNPETVNFDGEILSAVQLKTQRDDPNHPHRSLLYHCERYSQRSIHSFPHRINQSDRVRLSLCVR
jgi:hypothetical protein